MTSNLEIFALEEIVKFQWEFWIHPHVPRLIYSRDLAICTHCGSSIPRTMVDCAHVWDLFSSKKGETGARIHFQPSKKSLVKLHAATLQRFIEQPNTPIRVTAKNALTGNLELLKPGSPLFGLPASPPRGGDGRGGVKPIPLWRFYVNDVEGEYFLQTDRPYKALLGGITGMKNGFYHCKTELDVWDLSMRCIRDGGVFAGSGAHIVTKKLIHDRLFLGSLGSMYLPRFVSG